MSAWTIVGAGMVLWALVLVVIVGWLYVRGGARQTFDHLDHNPEDW